MNSAKIQKNMFCAYIIVASSEKLMLECLHRFSQPPSGDEVPGNLERIPEKAFGVGRYCS